MKYNGHHSFWMMTLLSGHNYKMILQSNIKNRIAATFIDFAIYIPIWIFYIHYFGEPNDVGGYEVRGWSAIPLTLIWLLYFPGMEAIRGQTIGHMLVGLKVVDISGKPVGFFQAFKRRLIDVFEIFITFGLIAYITVNNSDKHQRVGDIFAKTVVIGGEEVSCKYCHEALSLSPQDNLIGQFNCPNCNKINSI